MAAALAADALWSLADYFRLARHPGVTAIVQIHCCPQPIRLKTGIKYRFMASRLWSVPPSPPAIGELTEG
jgi:hypothetical protein